jgi:hypothetical protein
LGEGLKILSLVGNPVILTGDIEIVEKEVFLDREKKYFGNKLIQR